MKLPRPGIPAGPDCKSLRSPDRKSLRGPDAIAASPKHPPPGRPSRVIDDPRGGYFTIKLVRGGPRVPARIHMDRGGFWAEIDGKRCGAMSEDPLQADGVMRVWIYGIEIERAEYDELLARAGRPDPRKPANLRTARSIF